MSNDCSKKQRVKQLKIEIKKNKELIEKEQEDCLHKKESLKVVELENKLKEPRIICEICEKILRFPTEQELKEDGFK